MITLTNETIDAATELSARMSAVGCENRIRESLEAGVLNPVHQAVACAVILTNLGVSDLGVPKNDLSKTMEAVHARCVNQTVKWGVYLKIIRPISEIIAEKRFKDMINLLDTSRPVAAEPAPEPATAAPIPEVIPAPPAPEATQEPAPPKRKPSKPAAPEPAPVPMARTIKLPEFNPVSSVPVPAVEVVATDPMSVMAQSIMRHLEPAIIAHAQNSSVGLAAKVKSLTDAIAEELVAMSSQVTSLAQRPAGGGGGVDPAAVERIVTSKLSNGAGDELRKMIGGIAPTLFSDVLSKAADAVAAQVSVDHEAVSLTAALMIEPDPFYAWTPLTESTCSMIEQASQTKPQNALLVGPTGCGKTEFATQFAAKYKRPCLIMDCANLREAREWFGIKGVANGATYFRKSQFWLAVEAGNVVVILDEFNRAPDHVRNPLMPLLDHRRRSFVEEVGSVLQVGPRTVFFATLNEGLDYSGTHTTDRAMKNRFPRRIELGYLPEEKEKQVITEKVPGLKPGDAEKLVDLANTIRAKATGFGGGLSETLSTRQLIAAAEDFVIGGPPSFQSTVFNHFSAEGGTDSERAQVINMFQLKGYILA